MKKEYIKCVAVLGVICLIIAVALAAVNFVTAPIIKENAEAAVQRSLSEVLTEAEEFEKLDLPDGTPETVVDIYRDRGGRGYAVAMSTTSSYSGSPMTFTIGIGSDGKIVGIKLTNYAETKDFGKDYPSSYRGATEAMDGIDLVSGVTYSSTAFKEAVADAFEAVSLIGENNGASAKTDTALKGGNA